MKIKDRIEFKSKAPPMILGLINIRSQCDFVSYTFPQVRVRAKEAVPKLFMERLHLQLIIGGIIVTVWRWYVMRDIR